MRVQVAADSSVVFSAAGVDVFSAAGVDGRKDEIPSSLSPA